MRYECKVFMHFILWVEDVQFKVNPFGYILKAVPFSALWWRADAVQRPNRVGPPRLLWNTGIIGRKDDMPSVSNPRSRLGCFPSPAV